MTAVVVAVVAVVFAVVVAVVAVVAVVVVGSADQLTAEQTINREIISNKQQQSLTTATMIPC